MSEYAMYALIIWLQFLAVLGLSFDNQKLRKRNRELDRAGGRLAEDYIRARAQLSLVKPPTTPRRAHREQEPGSVLRSQVREDRGQGRA